jgi:hypothetical protein
LAAAIIVFGLQSCMRIDLLDAVEKDNVSEVNRLIDSGADPNAGVNIHGNLPLHWAAIHGAGDAAKALIRRGADINAKNNSGSTPLLVSVLNSHSSVAHVLIDNGADVNAEDKNGYTPLMVAIYKNNVDLAEYLIKKGADVNAVNKEGNNALKLAKKNDKIIEFLILNGADVGKATINKMLVEYVVDMAPPTNFTFDTKTNMPVKKEWDPVGRQRLLMPKLEKLIELGADPNALRIKGFSEPLITSSVTQKQWHRFALAGSRGSIVTPEQGGESLLNFCRKWKLSDAAEFLEKHGAR